MTVKYIIGHWTAGNLKPNETDLKSYQLLIDGEGRTYAGKPIGCANSIGGMNSITFNIACCGGLETSRLTRVQIEKFYKTCAEKIKQYGLTVYDFYTHAEIGEMCKDSTITKLLPYNRWLYQNKGKIDLTILPIDNNPAYKTNAYNSGNAIRNKIKWYLNKIEN